jgi:hypothetical protein
LLRNYFWVPNARVLIEGSSPWLLRAAGVLFVASVHDRLKPLDALHEYQSSHHAKKTAEAEHEKRLGRQRSFGQRWAFQHADSDTDLPVHDSLVGKLPLFDLVGDGIVNRLGTLNLVEQLRFFNQVYIELFGLTDLLIEDGLHIRFMLLDGQQFLPHQVRHRFDHRL